MSTGDESEANCVLSEHETQFVYQSGDEDVLWAVQEITAERGNKYKVKWAGIDPATRKPWAQSWVTKHDCTDDLVIEWKKKKKRLSEGKKRGRKTSAASRTTSGASASQSGNKTRRSASKTTSSRLDSAEQHAPAPPKQAAAKRKRPLEAPAATSSDVVQDEDVQGEPSRPRKKLKTMVEVLLPPLSTDDESEALCLPTARAKAAQKKVPTKSKVASSDVSGEEARSPPKTKGKSERRSEARLNVSLKELDVREESRLPRSKMRTKVVPRGKERVIDAKGSSSESDDEDLRPPKFKHKSTLKRKSLSEQNDGASEEVESTARAIKVGPPRGVKRQEKKLRESEAPRKPGPSGTKPRETNDSVDERVSAGEQPEGHLDREAVSFGTPLLLRRNMVDDHTPPPPSHISIPQVPLNTCRRSPDLSPGARARLELFDRMMAESSQPDVAPPPDASEHVADDTHFDLNDAHDTYETFDTFVPPPPLSSPPSKPELMLSKVGTANGLVVPEAELPGNSQSQSHSLQKPSSLSLRAPDKSPRKLVDLPTIEVIDPPATSSSSPIFPQDPPQKFVFVTSRASKKPTFKIAPSTSRSTTNGGSRVDYPEAPPSSIESFTSPRRTDKGKQKAIEEGGLEGILSEGEGDGVRQKRRTQKITDSQLKKRGKELFHEVQLARETGWQKNKKPKRLKAVNAIVNGRASSPSKGPSLPFTIEAENTMEHRWENAVDLSGGANSATLDTPEHSGAKPLTEEERQRLRIELRQEEEESTQEAMDIYPPPPVKESEAVNGGDAHMPPSWPSKSSPFKGRVEDADHVEQPSTDVLLASVIVQASQEQRHEQTTDIDPSPSNQPCSSPARPIPGNLTDSPRRRLGEALSLLNLKSEEIQRLERELADECKNLQGLETQLAELRQSSEPTGPVRAAWNAERAQWAQERSKREEDFALLETQRQEMSGEIASLSARVTELSDAAARTEEARVKLAELEAARDAWTEERDVLLNDMVQRSEKLATLGEARGQYNQELLKQEIEKTLWVEQRGNWETERAALQEKQEMLSQFVYRLTATIESMKVAKDSAEKDRDFFREQYVQASGFVDSVRNESVELEKRVKIAEGQAQEGVAAIKALFEGRVKTLQGEVDHWKGLTELLQERDRRTNDELRLRAAQAPEFEELCGRLKAENTSLEADVRKLGQAQQRSVYQRNRLFYEILLLKKERASLRSKLSKLIKTGRSSSTQETSHSVPALPSTEDLDPNDMELLPDPAPQSLNTTFDELALFPCMWRPQWRDLCEQTFDTKEDLERHMQGHLRDVVA